MLSAQTRDTGDALNSAQVHMVIMLWATYAAFYLGRLNLSPALPEVADFLQIGLGEIGILGNVFFWCYAVGQVISGQLGSFFQPQRIVLVGLILVAAANIGFAFQTTLVMMAVLWGINGFAQSMGWGPILRILSSKTNSAQKRRLALWFSLTFQVGTSLAWGIAAVLIARGGFRPAFLVPGLFLLLVALLWQLRGPRIQENDATGTRSKNTVIDLADDLRRIFPMLLVAGLIGFIYVGFLLWLPTLVRDQAFLPPAFSGVLTAVIPLIGIPGMLLSGQLLTRQTSLFRSIAQLLAALLVCLAWSAAMSGRLQIVPILLAVMFASGLAGLLLSAAPMLLVAPDRVSSAGGLITAVWSIAGGLAGTTVGSLAESSGWGAVFFLWMANAAAAIIITLAASRLMRHEEVISDG
jgi:sugar phosphate permease